MSHCSTVSVSASVTVNLMARFADLLASGLYADAREVGRAARRLMKVHEPVRGEVRSLPVDIVVGAR